jgi:hypothetical protein
MRRPRLKEVKPAKTLSTVTQTETEPSSTNCQLEGHERHEIEGQDSLVQATSITLKEHTPLEDGERRCKWDQGLIMHLR